MKTVILVMTLFAILAHNTKAQAGCIPHEVAEEEVSGRTYVLKNSPNPEYPISLTFGSASELSAGYGSALDGHPGGRYSYRGDCHGRIIVTFTSDIQRNSKPTEILKLRPTSVSYFELQSISDSNTVFRIAIETAHSLSSHSNFMSAAYKRYVRIPSFENPAKYICWDDKAGLEVSDSYCANEALQRCSDGTWKVHCR